MRNKTLMICMALVFAGCATSDKTASVITPNKTEYRLEERIRASWGSTLGKAKQNFSATFKDGAWTVTSTMNTENMTSPDVTGKAIDGMLGIGALVEKAYSTALPINAELEKAKAAANAERDSKLLDKLPAIPVPIR